MRALLVVCCAAAVVGAAVFILYLQPAWESSRKEYETKRLSEYTSEVRCTKLGACTLTNYCHNRTSVFPAFPLQSPVGSNDPLQLSSFPGMFTIEGVYDNMTDPVWFTPSTSPWSSSLRVEWRSTLMMYATAAWPNLRMAHLMLGAWAPLFFSIHKSGDGLVDLLVFQSGTLIYNIAGTRSYVTQLGGCIDPELQSSYRQIMPVRDIRCAGDAVSSERVVTRLDASSGDAVYCYKRIHAGLSITTDMFMRNASDNVVVVWDAFRTAFQNGSNCNTTTSDSLPSVYVIARRTDSHGSFGNRMFSTLTIRRFMAMLERLQEAGVIGRYHVGDMDGRESLMTQGCTFSQWSIVIGVHGNGFGWTPLLPRTSWIVILCRRTELSYCGFYGLVARSTGCNSLNYPVNVLSVPSLANLEDELHIISQKWRSNNVTGQSYTRLGDEGPVPTKPPVQRKHKSLLSPAERYSRMRQKQRIAAAARHRHVGRHTRK
jgi:hypothetical protein